MGKRENAEVAQFVEILRSLYNNRIRVEIYIYRYDQDGAPREEREMGLLGCLILNYSIDLDILGCVAIQLEIDRRLHDCKSSVSPNLQFIRFLSVLLIKQSSAGIVS